MNRPASRFFVAAAALLIPCFSALPAQCVASWGHLQASAPLPFGALVDKVHVWDVDGDGPAAPVVAFGGFFTAVGPFAASNVATYDPATDTYAVIGSSIGYEVDALTTDANGQLVAGGGGGVFPPAAGFVDVWDGATWTQLASANGYVWALATLPNGHLVAGGDFTTIGGVAATRVARFDGVSWHAMGAGAQSAVRDFELDAAGDLYAVGELVVAGGGPAPGGVARWDGVAWQPLTGGASISTFGAIDAAFDRSGALHVVGVFADGMNIERVARYDTNGWQLVPGGPDGPVVAVAAHPNGDLVVGGQFDTFGAGTGTANNVARWDGVGWQPLGAGLGAGSPHQVLSLVSTDAGEIVAGGAFDTQPMFPVGGGVFPPEDNLAVYSGSCMPQAQPVGVGCSSSGGALALAVTDLAWIGGAARALSGVHTPASIAVVVWGFGALSPSIPLASVFPFAQPGCSLFVTPDVLDFVLPVGPALQTAAAIPNDAALIGAELFHQVLSVEIGGGGAFTSMIASNAVRLVVGDL